MSVDTIFAVASGAGRAAVTLMRVSGPGTSALLDALCGGAPAARRASLRRLRGPDGASLDRSVVLWLPGPGSYTGEDSCELHLHGGRAVREGVADALARLGARPAEPGEFSRRAFLNGRMDLLEAEAVADLAAAETAAQRDQALRQLDGELSALTDGWAARLRRALAHQEALIDFPDEDLPADVEPGLLADASALAAELRAHLADDRRGERLRDGLVFAVTGAPNVGKSSLVNALAGADAAIVGPRPGTTRDAIEVRVTLGGAPVTLVDTAGLRETDDPVEAEGVRRARARAASADLVIELRVAGDLRPADGFVVCNKIDLGGPTPAGAAPLSLKTGEGLENVRLRLDQAARALTAAAGPPPLTRARHRSAILRAAERLEAAALAPLPELRAEDLRIALREIGRVTGLVEADEILGDIFGAFCIGK